MRTYFFTLFLLCGFVSTSFAEEPLTPGNYRGAWLATLGGVRTGGDIQLSIATNGVVALYYFTINEITGEMRPHLIRGHVISRKVMRGSDRFYAISQDHGSSVRGWYRCWGSTKLLRFYADYAGPMEGE